MPSVFGPFTVAEEARDDGIVRVQLAFGVAFVTQATLDGWRDGGDAVVSSEDVRLTEAVVEGQDNNGSESKVAAVEAVTEGKVDEGENDEAASARARALWRKVALPAGRFLRSLSRTRHFVNRGQLFKKLRAIGGGVEPRPLPEEAAAGALEVMTVEEVVEALGVNVARGLDTDQVLAREGKYGSNIWEAKDGVQLTQVSDGVRRKQPRFQQAALAAMAALDGFQPALLRDGRLQHVTAEELVPGDVIHLEAPALVPADVRLLVATEGCLLLPRGAEMGSALARPLTVSGAASLLPAHSTLLAGQLWAVTLRTGGDVSAVGGDAFALEEAPSLARAQLQLGKDELSAAASLWEDMAVYCPSPAALASAAVLVIALTDEMMGGLAMDAVCKAIHDLQESACVIVIMGDEAEETAVKAMLAALGGVDRVLVSSHDDRGDWEAIAGRAVSGNGAVLQSDPDLSLHDLLFYLWDRLAGDYPVLFVGAEVPAHMASLPAHVPFLTIASAASPATIAHGGGVLMPSAPADALPLLVDARLYADAALNAAPRSCCVVM